MIHKDDALTHATDYFRPFPEAEEVFTGDVEKHREYFLPLATVELSHINPSWSGIIPIVSPIEPYEGVVGEETSEFHTYLSRENWIAYHLSNGKIAFEGDWRLFEKEKYVGFYDATYTGYKKAKAYFKEYGCLRRDIGVGDTTGNDTNLLARLGGYASDGNWASGGEFENIKSHSEWVDEDGYKCAIYSPITEDGRLFEYIGVMDGSHFVRGDGLASYALTDTLVFFDPTEQIVLTTFEWT